MIERGAVVTVKRQAQLLDLSRSSVYYRPRPVSERDLRLMRRSTSCMLRRRTTERASLPGSCAGRVTRSVAGTRVRSCGAWGSKRCTASLAPASRLGRRLFTRFARVKHSRDPAQCALKGRQPVPGPNVGPDTPNRCRPV
jgi:hypothetical protein